MQNEKEYCLTTLRKCLPTTGKQAKPSKPEKEGNRELNLGVCNSAPF